MQERGWMNSGRRSYIDQPSLQIAEVDLILVHPVTHDFEFALQRQA